MGRQYEEFVVPEEREEVGRLWRKFVSEGRVFVGSRQFLRPDGDTLLVEVSASIVRLGEESTTLTILRDITDRRRAEQEIAERMELADFTSEIGAALIRDEPLPIVLQQCADAMMRHLEPAFARIVISQSTTRFSGLPRNTYAWSSSAIIRPFGSSRLNTVRKEPEAGPPRTSSILLSRVRPNTESSLSLGNAASPQKSIPSIFP